MQRRQRRAGLEPVHQRVEGEDVTAEIRRPIRHARPVMLGRQRCAWCRRILPERTGPGRPKKFCSQACRQWDWVHRQRADELQLSENELVVARDALDQLRDDLYVLACAIEDTERDLAAVAAATARGGQPDARELRQTLDWLLDAARTATSHQLTPTTL